jgi:hypothetical protein
LTNGFNSASGRVVVAASGNHVTLVPQTGGAAQVRLGPRFKVTGWTGAQPSVSWGGQPLTAGTDYNLSVDGANAVLYLQLNFDVVALNPGVGQRAAATLDIH